MKFLDIALACVAKGWKVFPCVPGDKQPITPHGFYDASSDPEQITALWTKTPNANVAIACAASGLTVLDCDEGLTSLEEFNAWRIASNLPETYTVRTGRRPAFGVQMYFSGAMQDVALWELIGCKGQIKSVGGYVMASGCLHPSGATYEDLNTNVIVRLPDLIRDLHGKKSAAAAMSAETKQQTELLDRFLEYYEVPSVGDWLNKGKQWFRPIICLWANSHENANEGTSSCVIYNEGGGYGYDCKHRCADRTWHDLRAELESRFPDKPRFAFLEVGPKLTIGGTGLPILAHATLAEAFLQLNHDFVCVYDLPHAPTAQWVGTRWSFSENDSLLWRAVADFLAGLYPRYEPPEKGADPRKRLLDAGFIGGVVRCVKPYLPAVREEVFDRDPNLLGLPECRAVDLSTSAVREMLRGYYITRRTQVTPNDNCSTERFNSFMDEIK
jgi:hypothetical protein